MNTLTDLAGQPRPLKVRVKDEVREYQVYPLTVEELASLQGWVDAQFPDPFATVSEAIKKHDFPVSQQEYLLDRAVAASVLHRHPIGTPEADRMLFSFEGTLQLIWLAIRKGKPDLTDAEVKELRLWMSLADLIALKTHTGIGAILSDPKAPSESAAANGSSTSRKPRKRGRGSTGTTCSTRR
jgi:hypothetical protein